MIRYARAVFLISIAVLPGVAQQPAKAPAAVAAPVASTKPATFVGSETCGMCHEDIAKALPKSPHGAVEKAGMPGLKNGGFKGQACEVCHGPGSNHVESLAAVDIRNPA